MTQLGCINQLNSLLVLPTLVSRLLDTEKVARCAHKKAMDKLCVQFVLGLRTSHDEVGQQRQGGIGGACRRKSHY